MLGEQISKSPLTSGPGVGSSVAHLSRLEPLDPRMLSPVPPESSEASHVDDPLDLLPAASLYAVGDELGDDGVPVSVEGFSVVAASFPSGATRPELR